MGGSQLKQLKAAISSAGLSQHSQPSSNPKKRKRGGAILEHREKRVAKLNEIHDQFNQFDVKITKLKHDVGGRKLKGVVGKPTASKQAGIEQRKKTLLAEYNLKGKSGGLVDRRFGENDPTMSLEERMLERFTRERRRTSKAAAFNLEDDQELTHYGQSLSKFDDLDGIGILDDEDEEDKGQIDATTVKKVHFGGFSDEDEGDDDGPPRKKTKAEVMAEVISKSKEHKYARQQQKEQDEDTRYQLDQDFDAIRGLLFTRENIDVEPTTEDSAIALGPDNPKPPPPIVDDYDHLVRELIFDKRSQPKDRTKTEEEIAQEEKEALEKAERARLRRMMGEEDEETDEEGERWKRPRGGDDLDDGFTEEDKGGGWAGIGSGLVVAGAPQASDDEEDAHEHTDPEKGEEDLESGSEAEDEDENRSIYSVESDGPEEQVQDSLESTRKPKGGSTSLTSLPRSLKELPFTFRCPSSHEEFLEILEGVDRTDIGTVIERIRKLHHPSLGEKNKYKLQDLTSVLLDHILYVSSEHPPAIMVVDAILPHFVELSEAYPIRSAEEFVKKLKVMQKNLNRGLQDPLSPSSKTFPGVPELILLRVLGGIWSTSDMKHAVVGPVRYLMGAYLGLPRIRSLADIASGLFLCTLFYEYEQDSKRFAPEVINFLVNTILLLAPTPFKDEASIPGTIPTPDFGAEYTQNLKIRVKKARDLQPGKPALFTILSGESDEQAKVDLLTLSVDLLGRFAEMYKPLDAFIEIYAPALDVLEQVQAHKLSPVFQARLNDQIDILTRLLRFSREGRQPLLLQAHKPIPIATFIPKFESRSSSSFLRSKDPDAERAAAQKLRAEYRREKKGAMRELRKDNRFLAAVVQERKEAQDRAYNERVKKLMGGLEGERAEQRREERVKAKEKKRAGKK